MPIFGDAYIHLTPVRFWLPKMVPGPVLVVKNGPLLPKLALAGQHLSTEVGLGDHAVLAAESGTPDQFGLLRIVLLRYFDCWEGWVGTFIYKQCTWNKVAIVGNFCAMTSWRVEFSDYNVSPHSRSLFISPQYSVLESSWTEYIVSIADSSPK